VSESCIYAGTLRHRRYLEREREFTYPVSLLYLDLDELPSLLGGLLVARRPGAVRVRREDYLGPRDLPLREAVSKVVARDTGTVPAGPIRLLTHPRMFGHCFNPVSFYYCFAGSALETVLAEVTNTPWGERHAYVLRPPAPAEHVLAAEFDKALHVSPFMDMKQHYSARITPPEETLSVHIESRADGGETLAFDATLALRRRSLSEATLRGMVARYPLATLRTVALIYAQAVRIRLAGIHVRAHPVRS
jgi:DUF1365 family protein